jgi:cyanate lyase
MRREQLTEKTLDIKRKQGWSWRHITDEIGGVSPILIVGALLGQMKLVKPLAKKAARLFGLSEDEERMLNEVPVRGTPMPPTDLPLLRACDGQWTGVEGPHRGGIRRRNHVGDRFRDGDRAAAA